MITFTPLSSFGAETSGIDLSVPLPEERFRELERAFYANQVLALRAQHLTAAQFFDFARRIGPPQPHVIVIPAQRSAAFLLLNPITATVLAAILLGERPSPIQLLGGILVLVGIALATGALSASAIRRRLVAQEQPSP